MKKILVVDATPPHFLEPQFPGVFDKIISVYESFNYEKLRNNRFKVADLFEENLFHQQQAVYLMSAAYGLLLNNIKMVGKYIDEEKLNCYINNLLVQDLNLEKRDNNLAGEELRFLTVITQGKQLSYINTVRSIADKVYVLNDDFYITANGDITTQGDGSYSDMDIDNFGRLNSNSFYNFVKEKYENRDDKLLIKHILK